MSGDIYLVTNPAPPGTAPLVLIDANNNQITIQPGASLPVLLSSATATALIAGLGAVNVTDLTVTSLDGGSLTNPSITSVQTMVPGDIYSPGDRLGLYCTVAGTFLATLAEGGTFTLPMVVGYSEWDWSVTKVSSITGTGTFALLSY